MPMTLSGHYVPWTNDPVISVLWNATTKTWPASSYNDFPAFDNYRVAMWK